MAKGYGQFCPIAKASEVICERWTPLILRELMQGSRHFNEIARGVPLMSRALLVQRLRELEDKGIVESSPLESGHGREYVLTPAGEAMRPIIEQMGVWAQVWGRDWFGAEDMDDTLLAWALRRRVRRDLLGGRRIVLRFDFRGLPRARVAQRSWWMILQPDDVDVCLKDPGFEVDVSVSADLGEFVRVVLGHAPLKRALERGSIAFHGPRELVRQVPDWLCLNGELTYRMGVYDGEPLPGVPAGGR